MSDNLADVYFRADLDRIELQTYALDGRTEFKIKDAVYLRHQLDLAIRDYERAIR